MSKSCRVQLLPLIFRSSQEGLPVSSRVACSAFPAGFWGPGGALTVIPGHGQMQCQGIHRHSIQSGCGMAAIDGGSITPSFAVLRHLRILGFACDR
eukprot:s5991_g2.t1